LENALQTPTRRHADTFPLAWCEDQEIHFQKH
jgi:hypothetical protein